VSEQWSGCSPRPPEKLLAVVRDWKEFRPGEFVGWSPRKVEWWICAVNGLEHR